MCPGELPTLQQLGFDAATLSRCAGDKDAAGAHLRGGESEALRRLSEFVSKFTAQQQQKGVAAGAGSSSSKAAQGKGSQDAAPNFCCKISPWLALGCLSPRQLYVQLQQAAGSQAKAAGQPQQLPGAGKEGDTGETLHRAAFCACCCSFMLLHYALPDGSSACLCAGIIYGSISWIAQLFVCTRCCGYALMRA